MSKATHPFRKFTESRRTRRITCLAAVLAATSLLGTGMIRASTEGEARSNSTSSTTAPREHTTTRIYFRMPQWSLEDFVDHADSVAHVVVESTRVEESANGQVSTVVVVTARATWLGDAAGTFELVVPGGETAYRSVLVPEAPRLAVGEEYVLFLAPADRGRRSLVGLRRGVYSIDRTQGSLGRVAGVHASNVDLADFQLEVHRAVTVK